MPTVAVTSPDLVSPSNRPLLHSICSKFGITWMALFGSYARGQARPESDIDVLVEWDSSANMTLLNVVDLAQQLSEVFDGRKVDVGRPQDLYWFIRDQVLAEAKVVYAR